MNGRNLLYDLHPFLFNKQAVDEYITSLREGRSVEPPCFEIELYLSGEEAASLQGRNNSRREDVPGVSLRADLNDQQFSQEYAAFAAHPDDIRGVSVEFYKVTWRNFAGNDLLPRNRPIKTMMIDTGDLRYSAGPQRFMMDAVFDFLSPAERAQLSLAHRKMRDSFLGADGVQEVNRRFATKTGEISDKIISVSLDATAKGSWEAGMVTNLDDIPFPLVGKGEQSSVKIQLSMSDGAHCQLFLIEEPENHLSFTNLNRLIKKVDDQAQGRQVLLTTHSSFVLNKLDVGNLLLFRGSEAMTLNDLTPETRNYFLRLPGHDTLRLILSSNKVILVEGPSDELIVQKAHLLAHGCLPLEAGVDVISVKSLAFKRFLEISMSLGIETHVITDNDGDITALTEKYAAYADEALATIHFEADPAYVTLESVLLRDNGRVLLNTVFGKTYETNEDLLAYMRRNKTECALAFLETTEDVVIPAYIVDVVT